MDVNVVVRGKNFPLTEAIEGYVHQKLGRLRRYWSAIRRISVTCSVEPTREVESRHHVEATVVLDGEVLHAEERAGDLYVAIDSLAEKLERQIDRLKGQVSARPGPAVWPEPELAVPEGGLILLRAEDIEAGKDLAGTFGDLPNLLGWRVVGPQHKQVGHVVGLHVHPDREEIADLLVEASGKEFTIPMAEARIEPDGECVRLRRNLSQIPAVPPEVRRRATSLRRFLEGHDVPEPTIERLEAFGVHTPRDLRARVEDGRLESLLGAAGREELHEIEHLIQEYT